MIQTNCHLGLIPDEEDLFNWAQLENRTRTSIMFDEGEAFSQVSPCG